TAGRTPRRPSSMAHWRSSPPTRTRSSSMPSASCCGAPDAPRTPSHAEGIKMSNVQAGVVPEAQEDMPFQREAPMFQEAAWDNGDLCDQGRPGATGWGDPQGTGDRRPAPGRGVVPELFTDPLLQQVYLIDLAIFVGGERTSVEAVSGLLRCAPDESSSVYL